MSDKGNKFNFKGLILILVLCGAYLYIKNNDGNVHDIYGDIYNKAPQDEKRFIKIISEAKEKSEKSTNDMQNGGIKSQRDKNICSWKNGDFIQAWVGRVVKISSNSDGKGVIGVEVSKGVTLSTWNNSFSDMLSETLIQQDTDLFKVASMLSEGDIVIFSGSFFDSPQKCLEEKSLTLTGKLITPDFVFKFSNIQKITE